MEKDDNLRVFTNRNGYVFINGSLQEAKLIRTDFKFVKEDGDGFSYFEAETSFKTPGGNLVTYNDARDFFYNSVEDFEANKSMPTTRQTAYFEEDESSVCADIFRGKKKKCTPSYWAFDEEEGCPVKKSLDLKRFYYDYDKHSFCTDEVVEDKIYDTREEALSFNTYKITKDNGDIVERAGTNKLLMLDEDQNELMHQLEEVMWKLKEKGVMLISDYQDGLYAFNTRNIEHFELDDASTKPLNVACGDPDDYEKADRFADEFTVKSTIEMWSDDFNLFVERKNNK